MSPRLSAGLIKDCDAICQTEDVRQILQCGVACQSDGLFHDASGCYKQVLTLKPKHFDALHLLGVLAIQTHRPHEAVALIAEAVAQNPRIELERVAEALDCCDRAIALQPTCPEAWDKRGAALHELVGQRNRCGVIQRQSGCGRDSIMPTTTRG
jgi:Flp pilus assembly protein TadD